MPPVQVTRTYLEMSTPAQLRPVEMPNPQPRIERIGDCPISFFRFLYAEVGRAFHWRDRLSWSDEKIRAHLDTPGVSLWLLSWKAAPAGYFELKRYDDDVHRDRLFRPAAGVFRERVGEVPVVRGRAVCLVVPAHQGLAAHLHPRPSGGPAELSAARFPACARRGIHDGAGGRSALTCPSHQEAAAGPRALAIARFLHPDT